MSTLIVWLFQKKTGLERYQLALAFSFFYFKTRSRLKAYLRVWNFNSALAAQAAYQQRKPWA